MSKIIIVSAYAQSLINFRGELIKEMVNKGHQVITLAPEEGFADSIAELGAEYKRIELHRTGTNPFLELRCLVRLIRTIRKISPDIVFSYALKPVLYTSIAARINRIKESYAIITGLGYSFTGGTGKQKLLRRLIIFLYRFSLYYNKKVYFQNPDDLLIFKNLGLVNDEQTVLINGSGVDTDKFYYSKPKLDEIKFLLMARLLRDKGIIEYVSAAKAVKNKFPHIRFLLLGPYDDNPSAISQSEVEEWEKEGIIEYLGATDDVRPYLADCSIFVLPSYREGTPRSVLEAMSIGRPIITTDAPGCKETVQQGVNGFLVPVKSINELSEAMEFFIKESALIERMGINSREKAIEKYDVKKVNNEILQNMSLGGVK